MAKSYFNSAITGNGRILACYNKKGVLERLFWPSVEKLQQLGFFRVGITFYEMGWETIWLDDDIFSFKQSYIQFSNILESSYTCDKLGLDIQLTEFALFEKDVLVRNIKIKNSGPYNTKLGIVVHVKTDTEIRNSTGIYLNHKDSIINCCSPDNYLAMGSNLPISCLSIGSDLIEAATKLKFSEPQSYNLSNETVLLYKLDGFEPTEEKDITLFLSLNRELEAAQEILINTRKLHIKRLINNTSRYFKKYFTFFEDKNMDRKIAEIVERSILTFVLLQNRDTGAILAAPEVDEKREKCGGYGYCWCRDAVFITAAMEEVGLYKNAESFYKWASKVMTKDGFFYQRYFSDGNYAPSWGIQIDETGSVLFGIWEHYKKTKDISFLRNMWDTVFKCASFLSGFIDSENGLPGLSYDIWEERFGQHAYSSAAVYAGIMGAYKVGLELNKNADIIDNWHNTATLLKKSLAMGFYNEDRGEFLRSIRVKINPWGEEPTKDTIVIKQLPRNDVTVSKYDFTRDISILGLSVPFGVFRADDRRLETTVMKIKESLLVEGGFKRYEKDNYIGGNPWVVSTLWMALFNIEAENKEEAMELFSWACKAATPLGFLPEQYDGSSFDDLWVLPLNWSHAMFILVLTRLIKFGWI